METLADIIIILFWVVFFTATMVALVGHATGFLTSRKEEEGEDAELEDDDPVFLFESYGEEY